MTTQISPVKITDRIVAIDVLRGFALLGILIMNIQGFSMPEAAYFLPTVYGDFDGVNRWVWIGSHIFADQKFMTIFSMLYGAGIILLTAKRDEREEKSAGLHYRRTFWLLVIGLAHAYLLWSGDILVTYAICAAVVFWFRKVRPTRQLIMGILVLLVSPLIMTGSYLSLAYAPPETAAQLLEQFSPSAEKIAEQLAAYRGGWAEQMTQRVPSSLETNTGALFFFLFWRASGLMLIGMALFKWGIFSAKRSPKFYTWMAILGFGIGLPLVIYGVIDNFAHNWDPLYSVLGPGTIPNYLGSPFVSLGYIAVIMRLVQTETFAGLQKRWAAVGRLALTNYLLQTILATLIFYGFGLGLFGSVARWQQLLIVFAIWLIQLAISPIWLRYFRFGPFEWLWRSLTYGRLQPMRI